MADLLYLEMNRLDEKYHRAMTKKEVAAELGISLSTMDRRIASATDMPSYKETRTGTLLFPLSAVAEFLTSGLVCSTQSIKLLNDRPQKGGQL